jgi:hypothetical protein
MNAQCATGVRLVEIAEHHGGDACRLTGMRSPGEEQPDPERTAAGDVGAWDVRPAPRRIVAIGDLHGDLRAFGAIGRACELLDERGSWCGGDTHLVLMGDLIGGDRSRLLLHAVMRLEHEARGAAGRVHALIGNHDLLPLAHRFEHMTPRERGQYQEDDFRGEGPFAAWMRGRPTMLRIGRTLFVHAGLGDWALKTDPAEVNTLVRAWIVWLQGKGPKPPRETRWAIDERSGPMWTRAFRPQPRMPEGAPAKQAVSAILERLDVDRVVLGHAPTRDGAILVEHPHYGEAVILVDTRISDRARGRLGALVIEGDARRAKPAKPARRGGRADSSRACSRPFGASSDAGAPTERGRTRLRRFVTS